MHEHVKRQITLTAQWVAIIHIIVLFLTPFAARYNIAEYWFVCIDLIVSLVLALDLAVQFRQRNALEKLFDVWAAAPFLLLFGTSPLAMVLNVGKLLGGLRAIGRFHAAQSGSEAGASSKLAVLFITLILYFATLIMIVEGAQNEKFNTFGGGLWWAVVTITTTGYGDVTPFTPLGRIVATLLMFAGIGVSSAIGAVFVSYLLRPTEEKILKRESEIASEEKIIAVEDTETVRLLRSINTRLQRLEGRAKKTRAPKRSR